jgi:hypothetical protein
VNYVDRATASSRGYISANPAQKIRIGVDSSTVITNPSSRGRDSVRISTQKAYTHGLIVADIQHIPGSVCGTWPALYVLPMFSS